MIALYLTFLGFILAFQALVSRKILFRLRTSWLDQKKIYYLVIVLGIFPVVQYLHQTIIPLSEDTIKFLQPYWWTIKGCWYISLISILIYLFKILIKSTKYTKSNEKFFFYECQDIISKGDIIEISDLSLDISQNIEKILSDHIKSSNNTQPFSSCLVALFSDSLFVKVITTRNAELCYKILRIAIDNSSKLAFTTTYLKNNPIGTLVSQVMQHLITEPDSYLQRENPNKGGLGYFMSIRSLILSDMDFIKGPFQPLTGWLIYNYDILDERSLSNYIEIVQDFFSKYLEEEEKKDSPRIFKEVLYILKDIVRFEPVSERKVIKVGCFIKFLMIDLGEIEVKLPKEALEPRLDPNIAILIDDDLYSILSNGIFEILVLLSRNQNHYETIRLTLLFIFDHYQCTSDAINAIKYRLSLLIERKLKENMEDRLFPQLIAAIVYTYGLREPDKCKHGFTRIAMQLLKKNFIEFYQDAPENAKKMLPDTVIIDIDRKLLIREKRCFGKHVSEAKLKLENS